MDSNCKNLPKTGSTVPSREASGLHNPWSLIWKPRSRSDSEHSISSTVSTQSGQSGTSTSSMQRQTSKNDDDYLHIVGMGLNSPAEAAEVAAGGGGVAATTATAEEAAPAAETATARVAARTLRDRSPPAPWLCPLRRCTMTFLHNMCCMLAAALVANAAPSPSPGRVPKVYNALITSGQNLAPSKSFPIYQPVYRETFGFPLQPTFYYGDNEFKNFFGDAVPPQSPSFLSSSPPDAPVAAAAPPTPSAGDVDTSGEEPAARRQDDAAAAPPAERTPSDGAPPPPPPATQSPIPLNEFGLPPAIVPLSSHPNRPRPLYAFDPYAQFASYYPQFDPYSDPYGIRSYPLLPPLYRFGADAPALGPPSPPSAAAPTAPASAPAAPPPAPATLDLNNYSGKDPAIPDVPPPPLPSGGLKSDSPSDKA